jgi:hypothetical protein
MQHRKHVSRDHYLLLCQVIVDTENTASSIVACWAVFTELLPGIALIKSVKKVRVKCFCEEDRKIVLCVLVTYHYRSTKYHQLFHEPPGIKCFSCSKI